MRNIMVILLAGIAITINAYADHWQDHWTQAVAHCQERKYEFAEKEFNLAIFLLEACKDETHPHLYVDRARLYALQNRYSEALVDLNKAIASEHLTTNDRIRGLVTRIFTCSNLGMDEQVLSDFDTFKGISPNFPKIEYTKDKIIIRNIPKSDCYKKLARAFLISLEICEKDSDIIELDSGIMIATRKVCSCRSKTLQAAQNKDHPPGNDLVSDCKWWCDKIALGGVAWCAKVFKRWDCQTGCIFAVDIIKDGCYWCCSEGSFYRKCIKPFEDIVSYMATPCDPYWD